MFETLEAYIHAEILKILQELGLYSPPHTPDAKATDSIGGGQQPPPPPGSGG